MDTMSVEKFACKYCGKENSCISGEKYCKSCNQLMLSQPPMNSTTRRMLRNKEFLLKYKKGKSCTLCGYNTHPEILEFHHVDGVKMGEVSKLSRTLQSIEIIKKEISKCILLCPNCHKELHLKEREWKSRKLKLKA